LQGSRDLRSRPEGGFEDSFETVRVSFRVKVDAWRLFVGATTTLPISLTYAPPRVTATLYANLATGNVVVEVIDPILGHRWPDWNYMGTIVDFFNQVPTRTLQINQPGPISVPAAARVSQHHASNALSAVTSFSLTPGSLQTVTLTYSNTQRDVSLYVPGSYSGTQVPLLMALHGRGQDASAMFAPSKHITSWAEAENFIAVFPNGLPRASAPPTSTNYVWTDDVNVPYLNYVMDVLMANAAIDRRRVYVIGFSAGANMTYRLAADRFTSQRIAAIATVAGHVGSKQTFSPTMPWENTDPVLNGAWPTSALFLQGGEDTTHPVLGGFPSDYSVIVQAFQTKVDLWRLSIGQLSGTGSSINLPYAPGRVTTTLYLTTSTDYAVVAAIDPSLGHAWPGWDFMGTIWSFFEQAPIRASVHLPLVLR
jgi:poly(3-hydroxybutyrate) depolymerase